jgi:hypothetical protein
MTSDKSFCGKEPPNKKFSCNQCGKMIGSIIKLMEHECYEYDVSEIVVASLRFESKDSRNQNKVDVKEHEETNENPMKIECKLCNVQFARTTTFDRHMVQTHNTEPTRVMVEAEASDFRQMSNYLLSPSTISEPQCMNVQGNEVALAVSSTPENGAVQEKEAKGD